MTVEFNERSTWRRLHFHSVTVLGKNFVDRVHHALLRLAVIGLGIESERDLMPQEIGPRNLLEHSGTGLENHGVRKSDDASGGGTGPGLP